MIDEITKMFAHQQRIVLQGYDNLFSANHRSGMIQRYGYTQAMTIKIEELTSQSRAE